MRKLKVFKMVAILALVLALPYTIYATIPTPLQRAISAIEKHYVAPNQLDAGKMFTAAVRQIEKEVLECLVEDDKSSTIVTVGLAKKEFKPAPSSVKDLADILKPIVDFVEAHRRHYPDENSVMDAAIAGITTELDPHTDFMPPKIFKEFKVGTTGKFGGLGIVIGIRNGYLTVISPIEGTPAWKAGLKSGDRIIQIGDESTINMSVTDAVNKLRGDIGTKVSIVIERAGKKPISLTLTRALITIDSVQHAIYTYNGKKFGYIRVKNFQSNTMDDFNTSISKLEENNPLSGIILDLRDNPGGLLDQAVEMTDRFLSDGKIVSTIMARGLKMEEKSAKKDADDITLPLIIITNQGSASGSEIVAGALKFNGRGITVGQQTFGKGTVQTVFELGDNSALKLTIAEYMAAGKISIQQQGIPPDILLIPVTASKDEIDVITNKARSEKNLEHTLSGQQQILQKPALSISYLQPKMEEEELYYSNKPNLENDFAVKLAAAIMAGAKAADPESLIKSANLAYPSLAEEEDKKIVDAMRARSIDWGRARHPLILPTPVSFEYRFTDSYGKVVNKLIAGQEYKFELTVKNGLDEDLARTIAVLEEPDYTGAAEHEIIFGRIQAGATVTKAVPLTFAASLPAQLIELKFTLMSDKVILFKDIKITKELTAAKKPQFTLKYKLSGGIGEKKKAILITSIQNIGEIDSSDKLTAVLYNECDNDLFIENGREALKSLAQFKSTDVHFSFYLNSISPPPSCFIRVVVTDMEYGQIFSQRLALTSAGLLPEAGRIYSPPSIELKPVPLSTTSEKLTIDGIIKDKDELYDWSIFVDDDKIAYSTNIQKAKTMPITVPIILKSGRNVITVVARNKFDITDSKKVVVVKQ